MSIAMVFERTATLESDVDAPGAPVEATVGTSGGSRADVELARRELAEAWQRLRDLNGRRERYLITLRSAGPDSDMLEVAAAKAGLEVLDRAMGEQRRVVALRGADLVRAEQGDDESESV